MKMKNKRAEQIGKKRKHLETRKAAKERRRGAPVLERPEASKLVKPSILIVCEGENTEPSYFRQFRLTSAKIKVVGEGYNTMSLVERAVEMMQQEEYDQVWCVFDKDDFPEKDFNAAIAIAESHGMQAAYSNQAFEYWIILHFEDHQGGPMHRSDYPDKLNNYLLQLGERYDKDKKIISEGIFGLLESADPQSGLLRRDLAIRRARRIYEQSDHRSPAKEESSTRVHLLVEEILKYV